MSGGKQLVLWMLVPLFAAALYTASIFYNRWSEGRERAAQSARAEAEADRKIVDQLGGGEMKILAFYADPAVVRRGSKALLCYGVVSAKKVRIEPDVEPVNPAMSRCIEVHPSNTTEYTLTATDEHGKTETIKTAMRIE